MNKLFSFNIIGYPYLRVAFDILPHILIAKLIQLGLSCHMMLKDRKNA